MTIKEKIKHWYTKPRSGKAFEFTNWVLNSPKAMEITLAMGHVVAVLIFLALSIWIYKWSESWAGAAIPLAFTALATWKLIKYINLKIKTKGEYIYDDLNMNQVFGGKNDTRKDDAESDVDGDKADEGDCRYFTKRIEQSDGQPERTDSGSSELLRTDGADSEETGDRNT